VVAEEALEVCRKEFALRLMISEWDERMSWANVPSSGLGALLPSYVYPVREQVSLL